MKLQSKKVRLPIAALGITALCAGGVGIFASPAFAAPAAIALNNGATSIGVGNFGVGNDTNANLAYALKVADSSIDNAVLSVESAPTGGKLQYLQKASNGAATHADFKDLSAGVTDEVQTLTFSAEPTTGVFQILAVGGGTGGAMVGPNSSEAAIASEVNIAIGAGSDATVKKVSATEWQVSFGGDFAGKDVPQLQINPVGKTIADTNGDPVTGTFATTTEAGEPLAVADLTALKGTDYVYVTGDTVGEYKFRIFEDRNQNNVLDAADERTSSVVTMNVYDINKSTPATTDDVYPTFTVPSPVNAGDEISAEVGFNKGLSLSDARGSGVDTGLGGRLNGQLWVDVKVTGVTSGVTNQTNQRPSYSTSTGKITYAVGTPVGSGSITLKGALATSAPTADADYASASSKAVTVSSNSVGDLDLATTEVEGKVAYPASNVATIKTGTSVVEYTAKAVDSTPDKKPVAGARVTFTIGGTEANLAKLTTDGTAGATTATTKVFTATTDAKGVATLKVTSSDTAAGMTYTVAAASNGQNGGSLTSTYAASAIDKVEVTSTSAELTPAVGAASVTLKGKLVDQFGAAFVPGSGDSQQVSVSVAGGTLNAPISGGNFSVDYKPAATANAGDTTPFTFTYGGVTSSSKNIQWASAAAASKVTLTAPLNDAKGLNILGNGIPSAIQPSADFGNATGEVTGTVFGSDNAALAYKSVTLSGSEGVWFSADPNPDADSTEKLSKTLNVVTNASGAVSGAYVFFTKPGAGTVTATSGTVKADAAVTVKAPSTGYSVTMDDVAGMPGSVLIVTGKVTDIFGNPVVNETVNLTTSNATVGTVGNSSPTTNNNGVFSTTFISGTNSEGDVDLTATLQGQTENAKPNADLVGAGVTGLKDGVYRATGTITIANVDLTLAATAKLTAGATGATAKLSGKYLPNTSVDIWSKQSGERAYSLLDSVKTNAAGNWSASTKVNKSTFFLAKSNGLSSASKQTQVYSKVSIGAKALKNGRVQVSANGDPNARGTITFWNGKKKLAAVTSDTKGVAKRTFSLGKKGQTKSVRVTFKAPGTGQGASKTLKIKLK